MNGLSVELIRGVIRGERVKVNAKCQTGPSGTKGQPSVELVTGADRKYCIVLYCIDRRAYLNLFKSTGGILK